MSTPRKGLPGAVVHPDPWDYEAEDFLEAPPEHGQGVPGEGQGVEDWLDSTLNEKDDDDGKSS